jgi:hypothetical protein
MALNPSLAENPHTDLRTLVRLSYDGDKPLTDEECDKIITKNNERARQLEEARLNRPRLPQTGTNNYNIIKKDIPYGGTIGNPVAEGIQRVVTLEVFDWHDDCNYVNFYNKKELDKFISELQQVSDHLDE